MTTVRHFLLRWLSAILLLSVGACGGSSGSSNSSPPPVDTVAPVISLIGPASVTLEQGSAFNDPGATASDNVDGDISTNIGTTGTVDINTIGIYTVTYSVTDSAGNAATPVRREINVVAPPDTTAPVIILIGDATMTHEQGTAFSDPGATATDDVDGDISANIIVTGSVDINTLGTYTLDYSAEDNAGNVATPVTRTVEVVPPPLTLEMIPTATKQFDFTWNDSDGEDEYRLLENPDGHSGFTEIASLPADTTGFSHRVALYDRFNAQYIVEACNKGVCTQSNTYSVSGNLATAIGYINASNANADDEFGFSIALSGDGSTLAVGAPTEDSGSFGIDGVQGDNSAVDAGAVYVFALDAGGWTQQAYLKASNTDAGDEFGVSVALSDDGNTLAVGAAGEASNATGVNGDQNDNSALDGGAVYVFKRITQLLPQPIPQPPVVTIEWTQQAYLKASNTDAGDEFGASVVLSDDGNTLAMAATWEDSNIIGPFGGDQSDNSVINSGAVYLFTRAGNDWSQSAYLKASNASASDYFGRALEISGDGFTLAAAAYGEGSNAQGIDGNQNDTSAINSGAVYVFTLDGGFWRQQAYIKASNTGEYDEFGRDSMTLSSDGNTLAVGARFEDSNATGINGDQDNDLASNSGAVYLFARTGSDWSQQAYIKASNTDAVDYFGRSVSLNSSGDTLAVGAYLEDSIAKGINGDQDDLTSNSGAVYVFGLDGGLWTQRAYLKASDTRASDTFGYAVALSGDGDTLAIGAIGKEADAGAVYLY